jgi:hypothetical protein
LAGGEDNDVILKHYRVDVPWKLASDRVAAAEKVLEQEKHESFKAATTAEWQDVYFLHTRGRLSLADTRATRAFRTRTDSTQTHLELRLIWNSGDGPRLGWNLRAKHSQNGAAVGSRTAGAAYLFQSVLATTVCIG